MEPRPPDSADIPADPGDPLADLLREALQPSYLLVRKLGEGGMGLVYLARDPLLKRDVAVKVLQPDLAKDEVARARFHREAEAVAAIAHPNVVSIYAIGALPGGTPYFVMQYASGMSLERRLETEGPLPIRDAKHVLGEVASALAAAHKRGIVHRDIKPANVLQDDTTGRTIVTDFGIAAVRRPGDTPQVKLTQTGMSPGTPYYMSPEQLLNEEATGLTDVYSFGVLAYELLTGAGPFAATSPHELAAAHLRDVPAPLAQRRPDADPELEQLVAACLAKQAAERPSAEQIAQRLAPGEHVLLEWPPPGLERLAGRLPVVNGRFGLGSTLVSAAVLLMLLANPDRAGLFPPWVLVIAAFIGLGVLVNAVEGARRLARDARRSIRTGYSWLTVLETVADRRGDTGALITGLREYAPLAPLARSRVRSWRVVGAICRFGAAVAPLPTLLLLVHLGASQAVGPWTIALLTYLPSVALGIAAWGLRRAEGAVVRRPNKRRKRVEAMPKDMARRVVAAWTESFETARAGQPLGGRTLHPVLSRGAVSLVLLAVVVATVTIVPIAIMAPIVDTAMGVAVPKFSEIVRRVRRAEVGRAHGVQPDPAVTPEMAGRAFHALSLAGERHRPRDMRAPEPLMTEPFLPPGSNPFGAPIIPLQDSLIRRAAHGGFTPEQRAWLERLATHPGFTLVGVAARGRVADIIGARYTIQSLDTNWWSLPIPRLWNLREAGYARAAVAALRLSQGRREEAETLLREEISFGLGLMDNGPFEFDTWAGSVIASNGLDRLATFYRATGRGDLAERLRDERDSALARTEREDARLDREAGATGFGLAAAYRAGVRRMLTDSTLPKGLRLDVGRGVALEPCRHARELVFGPSPAMVRALETLQRQTVLTSADSALFRAQMRFPFGWRKGPGVVETLYRTAVASIGWVLGTPRFEQCAWLIAP